MTVTAPEQTEPVQEPVIRMCGGTVLSGRARRTCPTCQCRRRFVLDYSGPYYGTRLTCLGCGDAWEDGWRQKAIRRASERYVTALPKAEFDQAVMTRLRAYFDAMDDSDSA